MANPNPVTPLKFKESQFVRSDCTTDSLAHIALSVRVPIDVDRVVRSLNHQKSSWLRRVITEAARRELMQEEGES
jgi:hypothetical protein